MKSDRELLELAAKAAGMTFGAWRDDVGAFIYFDAEPGILYWNPLTIDRDAFRLAVKLGLIVEPGQAWVSKHGPMRGEDVLPCPYAATRRAIVRAAADIGRSMK